MDVETCAKIEASCSVIGAEYTDAELTSTLSDRILLGSVEKRCAISTTAKMLQHNQVTNERELAWGIIEFLKWHSSENSHEPRNLAAAFNDEDSPRINTTSIKHLRKVLSSHCGARPKARIDRPFVLLQLDYARANGSRVVVSVGPELYLTVHIGRRQGNTKRSRVRTWEPQSQERQSGQPKPSNPATIWRHAG